MKASRDDIVFMKLSSGPVTGFFKAGRVDDILISKQFSINQIKDLYQDYLGIKDDNFWIEKKDAQFCTLIWIEGVTKVEPFSISKKDPRAWIVLQQHQKQTKKSILDDIFKQ
jgi:hypothetical protein